ASPAAAANGPRSGIRRGPEIGLQLRGRLLSHRRAIRDLARDGPSPAAGGGGSPPASAQRTARPHGRGGLEDAGRGTHDSGARAALRRVARDDLGSTEEGETLVTARLPLLRECPNHSYERPLEHACPRAVEGRSTRDP